MEKPCQEEPFQSNEEGTAQQDGSSADDYGTAFGNDPFQLSYQKHSGNSFKILLGLYKGHYLKFFLSTVFYVIKHSPSWVLPIVTANILNCVTGGRTDSMSVILFNAAILIVLVILNVPMNYLHTHFRSSAIRDVEAGLRSSLVHKIQQLSIP